MKDGELEAVSENIGTAVCFIAILAFLAWMFR